MQDDAAGGYVPGRTGTPVRDPLFDRVPPHDDDAEMAVLGGMPEGCVVLLVEFGVLVVAGKLCSARLFELLDGNYRVIAAVRDRSTPLLDDIRAHAKSVNVSAKEANTPEFVAHAREILRL